MKKRELIGGLLGGVAGILAAGVVWYYVPDVSPLIGLLLGAGGTLLGITLGGK